MRSLIIFLVLTAGCSSQVGAPEKKREELIARIALTSHDTNNRIRRHEDFADAADIYLSDVDKILVRTEKRLKNIEGHLLSIDVNLDVLKIKLDLRRVIDEHLKILEGGKK